MTRTAFLREQILSGASRRGRAPLPNGLTVAQEPVSLTERKALALKLIFDTMPIVIGEQELIVGTRTFFCPNPGNEDGHDVLAYGLPTHIPYLNEGDVARFTKDQSYFNRTHYTPDFGIVLKKGIGGILREAEQREEDPALPALGREFLCGVKIAYRGLKNMILRYAAEAERLAKGADGVQKEEYLEIARVCRRVSTEPPITFREAIQLLWFVHLGTIIESFEFINYGRLDVLLGDFLKDTPREFAQQLIECLLLKMYDQTDLVTSYLGKYASQLVITLGGVLPNGENAVNEVTMMLLEGVDRVRLPVAELNLRVHPKNPPQFLDRAAALTVNGCNYLSYFNDELWIQSLHRAGIPLEDARSYGFDLCQDVNIPGRGDFWRVGSLSLARQLMKILEARQDFADFDGLLSALKESIADALEKRVADYNVAEAQMALYADGRQEEYFDGIRNGKPIDRFGNSPMAPLPLLSPLFHGSMEQALDVAFQPYPIKEKGFYFEASVEAVNSLAAIKKTVYDEKKFTLAEIYEGCVSNFAGQNGKLMQRVLWNSPKWGNDDDYVDAIAKDLLEFCLRECQKHRTYLGGQVLGGIHQPHPVPSGKRLMATPDGRAAGTPVAVTLTPASGTVQNGPTAVLRSAAKIDPMLVQWNYCVMVNYFASVFQGNEGKEHFKALLDGYFRAGGLQHQPNVSDVEELKRAQIEPRKYKDLTVRLWGVSAHFVDLPRELQDEMIARFSTRG